MFSSRERKNTERAGHLIKSMGFPSRADMMALLSTGVIRNCPISGADVRNHFKIYGGLEGTIKGKTVRRRPLPVKEDLSEVPIPRNILGPRNLCIDIFFADKAPFFTSISRKIMRSGPPTKTKRKGEISNRRSQLKMNLEVRLPGQELPRAIAVSIALMTPRRRH